MFLYSSGEHLIQKNTFTLELRVATDAGLVVPVIRDVDQKSIWDLASEVMELSSKAKEKASDGRYARSLFSTQVLCAWETALSQLSTHPK